MTAAELVKALRCSATVEQKDRDCTHCKYRLLEKAQEDIPFPPELEIDGVKYWERCDCDRMVLDAANMIEKLSSEE